MRAAAAALVAVAVAGCASQPGHDVEVDPTPSVAVATGRAPTSASANPAPATSAARPSSAAACASGAAGETRRALTVGGVRRSYLLDRPSSPGRHPLVIDLHGYGQSAAQQESYTGLGTAGRAAGVLVATPDGYDARWNFPRRSTIGPDDVAFLRALVAAIPCVDPARIVLTGISDGADMADTAGCSLPVAAVLAVAPSVTVQSCTRIPPTYVEVHGTADPIVPYAGGGGDRPAPFEGTEAVAVATRMAAWAAGDRCASPASTAVTGHISRERWSCPAGVRLALYSVAGGGHTWPGAAPWPSLGATTTEKSSTAAVLALAEHPARLPW